MTELDTDRFLTVQEVADVLRVSRWSVGRYIGAGALEAIKGDGPNGSIRIPLRSLHAYIEAHTVAGSERGRGDPPVPAAQVRCEVRVHIARERRPDP